MRATAILAALLVAPGAARAADDAVVATVNGRAITRAQLVDRMTLEFGERTLAQLIDEELIREAAERAKVKVEPAEIEARLKPQIAQFGDEAHFRRKLEERGTSLEALRTELGSELLSDKLVVKARGLKVTDAEARAVFEREKDKLGTPPALHVRHILVGSEKDAQAFTAALRAGADFAKVASQVSLDLPTRGTGGLIGWVPRGVLRPQFEQVVYSLKPGQISDPVKTSQGYEIFKVEAGRPALPAVYKDHEREIKDALLEQKLAQALPDYLAQLREKAKISRQLDAQPQRK